MYSWQFLRSNMKINQFDSFLNPVTFLIKCSLAADNATKLGFFSPFPKSFSFHTLKKINARVITHLHNVDGRK